MSFYSQLIIQCKDVELLFHSNMMFDLSVPFIILSSVLTPGHGKLMRDQESQWLGL